MSYRNDHDAALDRIAALEGELARMQRAVRSTETAPEEERPTPRREPEREERTGDDAALMRILLGGAGTLLLIVAMLVRAGGAADDGVTIDEPTTSPNVAMVAPVAMDDEACMQQVREWAARDARAADPREWSRTSPAELLSGPVPCGRRAHVVSTSEEDNVASLITVYYENDPVALDGYASAERLWLEYHRARAMH